MRCVIALESYIGCSRLKLLLVVANSFGRVELVTRSRQMKDLDLGRPVSRIRVPVARQTAAYTYDPAQAFRVRKREAIIQRARLREADKIDPARVGDALFYQPGNEIKQRPVMKRDGFFGPEIR